MVHSMLPQPCSEFFRAVPSLHPSLTICSSLVDVALHLVVAIFRSQMNFCGQHHLDVGLLL